MDFLRQLAANLHALRGEAKRKHPVVKEAVERALEALPALQQQYAALPNLAIVGVPADYLLQSSHLSLFSVVCLDYDWGSLLVGIA
ncbi:hypothetical protein PF005_g1227 [Phytophthora fragariae]|uniref:Mon2/Sec7/BIG1-like dimerisation and cyclophilin-binding domain-containing protein n=1 Tax=Phytophthora fragariae TaxID=53985 RepID=A0A6A3ZJR1_9STRA|nr:hypothetical protein PF003_g7748 [Phytophthora fragariae]KAE8944546.1 hypothetical protein PF009_g5775 [Phytophthora fragariae]KAE9021956.1 hypothetical protein PF011_g4699 [Phytophthora fragariae]KAE9132247.1 hypothetical protein PF010_g3248 [Phytophthora fragariae]KAE9138872.1 hypothetical protein PF007_g1219 [Phytophthora fragariae]